MWHADLSVGYHLSISVTKYFFYLKKMLNDDDMANINLNDPIERYIHGANAYI